jgi:SAM-dependent methyltransferase
MNQYANYFRDHFNIAISEKDIVTYHQWFQPQWNFLNRKVKLTKKTRVLEIGSGIGGFYSFLRPIIDTKNYVGLEMDSKACAFTNMFFRTKNFKNQSIESFSTKTPLDFIFAFEVLEHLENPNKAIQKISVLLDKKGVFVGTSPYPYRKNIYADETHRYVLHPSNWKKLFEEHEFTSVETYPMSFFPYLWRISSTINLRIPFYIPFPYCISTTLIIAQK